MSHPIGRALLTVVAVVSVSTPAAFATPAAGPWPPVSASTSSVPGTSIPGMQLWVSRYNADENFEDVATSIGVSPDGTSVFVTGFSFGQGTGSDVATIAYDEVTGATLWIARYNGPANLDDSAAALKVSSDGKRVFVVGASQGFGICGIPTEPFPCSEFVTIAYDAGTGAQIWVRRYSASAKADNGANALVLKFRGDPRLRHWRE